MPVTPTQTGDFLSCNVCLNTFNSTDRQPVSLLCGHNLCQSCLATLTRGLCPLDQNEIHSNVSDWPVNTCLLLLLGYQCEVKGQSEGHVDIEEEYHECYMKLEEITAAIRPFVTGAPSRKGTPHMNRPMQRKIIGLLTCQIFEKEGRVRLMRSARSLAERTVSELINQYQTPQQLSSNLWASLRSRGCQFLGPEMQKETLRLILLALEDGSALSRKVLVMFVVQRLQPQFPHASKTSVGHVVQLLYRASCFIVTKRDSESSLMQLKETFRAYDTLRQEHDGQILQVALESGLRIPPDQWSMLLYGDLNHKSHIQSIIDRLQTPTSFNQNIEEFLLLLTRIGDPGNLNRLRTEMEYLSAIPVTISPDQTSWVQCVETIGAVKTLLFALVDMLRDPERSRCLDQNQPLIEKLKYKTSLCREMRQLGECPRGNTCSFAHSQEELEQHRLMHRQSRSSAVQRQKLLLDRQTPGGNDNVRNFDESSEAEFNSDFENLFIFGLHDRNETEDDYDDDQIETESLSFITPELQTDSLPTTDSLTNNNNNNTNTNTNTSTSSQSTTATVDTVADVTLDCTNKEPCKLESQSDVTNHIYPHNHSFCAQQILDVRIGEFVSTTGGNQRLTSHHTLGYIPLLNPPKTLRPVTQVCDVVRKRENLYSPGSDHTVTARNSHIQPSRHFHEHKQYPLFPMNTQPSPFSTLMSTADSATLSLAMGISTTPITTPAVSVESSYSSQPSASVDHLHRRRNELIAELAQIQEALPSACRASVTTLTMKDSSQPLIDTPGHLTHHQNRPDKIYYNSWADNGCVSMPTSRSAARIMCNISLTNEGSGDSTGAAAAVDASYHYHGVFDKYYTPYYHDGLLGGDGSIEPIRDRVIISKWGPISRGIKTQNRNTGPIHVNSSRLCNTVPVMVNAHPHVVPHRAPSLMPYTNNPGCIPEPTTYDATSLWNPLTQQKQVLWNLTADSFRMQERIDNIPHPEGGNDMAANSTAEREQIKRELSNINGQMDDVQRVQAAMNARLLEKEEQAVARQQYYPIISHTYCSPSN